MLTERFIDSRLKALNGIQSRDNEARSIINGYTAWLVFGILSWESHKVATSTNPQDFTFILSSFLAGVTAATPFFIEFKRQEYLGEKKKKEALDTVFRR